MCDCKNIEIGSYKNSVLVKNPFTKKRIYIDRCILPEIKILWRKGIHTTGCCCGHNKTAPSIVVTNKYRDNMVRLGYRKMYSPYNKNIFYSKTLHTRLWFRFKIEILDRIKYFLTFKIWKI